MSVKSEHKERLKELLKIPSQSRNEADLAEISDLVSVSTYIGHQVIRGFQILFQVKNCFQTSPMQTIRNQTTDLY